MRMGVVDMNDDDLDWMSYQETVTHVERTVGCYRQKAIDLVYEAADGLRLKTRTVYSSPGWIVSEIAPGRPVFHSDQGERIECYRKDVLKLWPERQNDVT